MQPRLPNLRSSWPDKPGTEPVAETAMGGRTQAERKTLPAVATRKARRSARFKQTELERTVKAMQKAGLKIAAVKVKPDGTFVVIPGRPASAPPSAANPWDVGDA